jgi:hypothetical protein
MPKKFKISVYTSNKVAKLLSTGYKLMHFVLWQEDEPVIYPKGLLFLLEDYIAKLDHCLPSTVKRISSLAVSQQAASMASIVYANLDRIATPLIARRAVKLLTFILRNLETTAQYCQVNII